MRYITWVIGIIFLSLSTALLHYTFPQTDIVRFTNTYEKRIDFRSTELFWADGARDDTGNLANRDIFFIETFTADGEPMVYRNEDTGWNWPPYFKFDTSNLQPKASNAKRQSDMDGPQWVAIKHYGWRRDFFPFGQTPFRSNPFLTLMCGGYHGWMFFLIPTRRHFLGNSTTMVAI